MEKEKINSNNLIWALLFLVFGIILLCDTGDLLAIASKVIGLVLILIGIIKSIIYIYMKGKLGDYSVSELTVGLSLMAFGILLIIFSDVLSLAITLLFGLWALFTGINRIVFAINVRSIDKTGFMTYLGSAIVMIVIGILLVTRLFDNIIGLLIIIYSLAELVDYVYYNSKNKTPRNPGKKKSTKKLKNEKVVEAVIEE